MTKILFFINSPTPYQLQFFDSLRSIIDLKVIFHEKNLSNYNFKFKKKKYAFFLENSKKNKKKYIESFIKKHEPKFIVFGGYKLKYTYLITKICKNKNIKFLFWLEKINFKNKIKRAILDIYFNLYLKKSWGILAVGLEAKKYYQKYNKNTINFHYSIQIGNILKKNYLKKNIINFLYVGQFIERKNVINLISAFKSIKENNIKLTLIGEGALKNKMNILTSNDKRINIINFKNKKFLKEYYNSADVFILPSKYDGWGVVIMEAMANKCAIIVTKSSGVSKEFIKENYNGKIINTSVKDITKSIKFYITNKGKIANHGNLNKKIITKSIANSKIASVKLKEFLLRDN